MRILTLGIITAASLSSTGGVAQTPASPPHPALPERIQSTEDELAKLSFAQKLEVRTGLA